MVLSVWICVVVGDVVSLSDGRVEGEGIVAQPTVPNSISAARKADNMFLIFLSWDLFSYQILFPFSYLSVRSCALHAFL